MTSTPPIQGSVARILNSRELVINRGSVNGVERGMHFVVIEPAGEEIRDPETGEILGSLKKPKVYVEIAQVGDKLSVARTYLYKTENVGGSAAALAISGQVARMFAPPVYVRHYDTLKSEDVDWEPIDESESYVSVGDPVVQVIYASKDDREQPAAVIADIAETPALNSESNEPPS